MFKTLTRIVGGDPVRREIERYQPYVEAINELEPTMRGLSDAQLRGKTAEFRGRLADGETLDDILPEAFAVVRECSVRSIGLRHFDVQLIGGVVLHQGQIAEMRTGEGKTLVATMPIYLNALQGKGVHLVTVNDYLARRDARWMGPIFDFLGLSVGVLQEAARTENGRKAFVYDPTRESVQEDVHQLRIVDRRLAYAADVTYGTNNEFGFDYLRDNMARRLEDRVQRGHNYAILDEVDNILIDEARTPLIISGPAEEDPSLYQQMAQVVKHLRAEDYEISERDRTVSLSEIGENHVEELLGTALRDPDRPEDITPEQARMLGYLEQALRAEFLFKRNKDYVVQGGRVIIVDEFTGRLMQGRRWSDGLHQAVEAKEGVRVRQDNVTYATITLQNYFRMYDKLAGMTGTAVTEAEEFNKIYNVDVTPLPTNLEYIALSPETDLVEVEYREDGSRFFCYARSGDEEQAPIFWKRKDYPDAVYRTEEAKLRAVTTEILRRHVIGQPLLVGTTSVELSERLSGRLRSEALQRLAMVMLLRDAYLESKGLADDGTRVEELMPLYQTIDALTPAVLRPFARELDLSLNPARDRNLERLTEILELEASQRERLREALEAGIRHNVLNAKKHDEESRIIADAGAFGAVTIATNMAGRGVDIRLGGEIAEEVLAAVNRVLRRAGIAEPEYLTMEERLARLSELDRPSIGIYESEIELYRNFIADERRVREAGGLHVIGSERHESRRIDNQLRGRSARQGDPGSSQFFLSLEDELMRLFGGSQVSGLMERLRIDEAVPIGHSIVDRTIEQAQMRVEGANFDTRKHLLEYDDVLNQQREVFYGQRNRVFAKDDIRADVDEMLSVEVENHVRAALQDPEGPWKLLAWLEETQPTLNLESDHPYPSFMLRLLLDEVVTGTEADVVKAQLLEAAALALDTQKEHLARSTEEQFERSLDHLEDQVRQRVEMAETAIDGAMLEAETNETAVDPQALVRSVEENAGLKLQIDKAGLDRVGEEPDRFRDLVPEIVEASLGVRVWAGMVQAVERRIGESLGLQSTLGTPIDWDAASEKLLTALDATWEQRKNRTLEEIRRELQDRLSAVGGVDERLKTRLLVQLSYGQRTFFDRKTHQRRTMVVPRLSYAFAVASKLSGRQVDELSHRVLDHLRGAQGALERSLGNAGLIRNGAMALDQMDPLLQAALRRELETEEYTRFAAAGPINSLDVESRTRIAHALGSVYLMEAYRGLILAVGDRLWIDYLTQMEALRTSIGLEAYGQRDPLVQYKSRAFDMFQQLTSEIRSGVVSNLFRSQAAARPPQAMPASESTPAERVPEPVGARPDANGDGDGKKRRRRRKR
jgi:preprotein translocase subunit SecA